MFPLVQEAVPSFVYDCFYPQGWQARQYDDLASVIDDEPESVDVAVDGDTPVGWVYTACTRTTTWERCTSWWSTQLSSEPASEGRSFIGLSHE